MVKVSITKLYKVWVCLVCFMPLVGCVTVPHPFEKESGQGLTGLTEPPPSRLIIPIPTQSLLNDKDSALFSEDMVKAMLDQTVPAVVKSVQKDDWVLNIKVISRDAMVVPTFSIVAPNGKVQATREGMPVSAKDWSGIHNKEILNQVAQQAAPVVTEVLTGLQARHMDSDPNSLKHRAAKVYFKGVVGAPGDGNRVIAQQFSISFPDQSNALQFKADKADYVVSCHVNVTDGPAGVRNNPVQHVDIVWEIMDSKGKEAGKVSQINDVPAHSLDVYWGDVGTAVGEEAAGGIKHVISNYSGRDNKPLPSNGIIKAPLVEPPELQKK